MSVSEMPMGIKFDPTDEELIKFLSLKVKGKPLPWKGLIYKDLYGPNAAPPWEVFSDDNCYWLAEKEKGCIKSTTFVFTKLIRAAPNRRTVLRAAGRSTWIGQSGPKNIVSSDTGETIGELRTLMFKSTDPAGESPDFGHWNMHEYSLKRKTSNRGDATDLVVCKVLRRVKDSALSRPQPPRQQLNPANKRAAVECIVHEERKMQKSGNCVFSSVVAPYFDGSKHDENNHGGDTAGGFAAPQFLPPQEVSSKEEKSGDGDIFSKVAATAEDDDSCWLAFLELDENIGLPCGGGAFPEKEQATAKEFDPLLIEYGSNFDMENLLV